MPQIGSHGMKTIQDLPFLKEFLGDSVFVFKTSPRYPLVVAYQNQAAYPLPTQEEQLLEKILEAIQLSLSSIKLMNCAAPGFEEVLASPESISAPLLLAFGVRPSFLPEDAPLYQAIVYPETQVLLADSLTTLSQNPDLKRQLWEAIKPLFF